MIEDEQRVQLPRLLQNALDGNVLKEQARLHPSKLSPTLRMQPLSTATMIIPEEDPEIVMHDWMELYNQHGSCGIFRVVDIQPAYGKNRSITLNHALDILNDAVYPSNTEEFDGTVTAYLTKLLGAQKQKIGNTPYWQLGTVADTGNWHQEFNYDNILELIKEVPAEHEDYYYTFDFSVFPWRLNLVARNDDVLTEFRASRNIESCKVTQSDKDQCTRLYLSVTTKSTVTEQGRTAGKKSTTTFETHDDSTGQAVWGIIEKTAGIETDKVPAAQKAAWVQGYFERHRDPAVQITIDGYDLKEQTGESIDEMHLARVCRAVLPRYNTTLLERIVEVTYPDALRQPDRVSVSMANKRQTTEDNIASAQKEAKKAGGSGGKAKQKAENNETEIERQKIIYSVDVTKTNEYFRVLATESEWNDLKQQYETASQGLLNVTARDITSAVGRITTVEGKVSTIEGSTLWMNRENIATVTGKMEVDSSGNLVVKQGSGLYVTRNGSKLGVWDSGNLTAGIIVDRINGGTVTIQASKVDLGDYATVGALDAAVARIDNITSSTVTAGTRVSGATGLFTNLYGSNLYVNGGGTYVSLANAIISASGFTEVDGRMTLYLYKANNEVLTPNFNIADTTAYRNGVSAAQRAVTINAGRWVYDGNEGGLVYTVTTDYGQSLGIYSPAMDIAWDGTWTGNKATVTAYLKDSGGTRRESKSQEVSFSLQNKTVAPTTSSQQITCDAGYQGLGTVTIDAYPVAVISTISQYQTAVYDDSQEEYTVYVRASGANITAKDQELKVSGSTARGYGYREGVGEFTLASVKLEGASGTVYIEDSSGTDYYQAGSAFSYYSQGSSFTVEGTSAGTIYKRKTSGSVRLKRYSSSQYKLYYKDSDDDYYSAGTHIWWYEDTGGTYYYLGDGSVSDLKNPGTVTKHEAVYAGTTTPIIANTKKTLKSATRYAEGSTVTDRYYTRS